MMIRVPKRFKITPEGLIYSFAAFNGLAYYALILLISQILPFEKGIIRFGTSVLFLLAAGLLYLRCQSTGYQKISRPWPLAVKFIIAYFAWALLSFLWSNPEGFETQGFAMNTFYFAQWLNYVVELATVMLLCGICPIEKLTLNYLKGLRIGGFILAGVYLFFWLFIAKTARLAAFGGGVDVLHPNNLALKMAIVVICSLHLYFVREKDSRQAWWNSPLFIILPLFALVLTIGKTVLVGFFIALLFYVGFVPANSRLRLSAFLMTLLVVIMSVPLIFEYLSGYIAAGNLETLSGRTELWMITWQESFKHPFIGHGIASPFPTLAWNENAAGHSGTAHNEYLNAFYEMGIIGFAIIAMIYGLFLRSAFRLIRHPNSKKQGVFCMAIFILMFVFSLTASFPVGFAMPVTFQVALHCWMSKKWKSLPYLVDLETSPQGKPWFLAGNPRPLTQTSTQ